MDIKRYFILLMIFLVSFADSAIYVSANGTSGVKKDSSFTDFDTRSMYLEDKEDQKEGKEEQSLFDFSGIDLDNIEFYAEEDYVEEEEPEFYIEGGAEYEDLVGYVNEDGVLIEFDTPIRFAQPSRQSGTGTYSTSSGGFYATLGYSMMFGGVTTSISEGDNAHRSRSLTTSAAHGSGFSVSTLSGNERRARGSIRVLTAAGTYRWYNYDLRINPANWSGGLSRGRSLVDNLLLEVSGTARNNLRTALSKGGTAWINAINSGRTSSQSHATMSDGRLWNQGSSNYTNATRVYSRSNIRSAFTWTSYTDGILREYYDNQFTFPPIEEADNVAPTITSFSVLNADYVDGDDYYYAEGTRVRVRMYFHDVGTGVRYAYLRSRQSHTDFRQRRAVNSGTNNSGWYQDGLGSGNMSNTSTTLHSYNSSTNTGNASFYYEIERANSSFILEYYLTDEAGNTRGYNSLKSGLRVRSDHHPPRHETAYINGATHVSGNDHWIRPGQEVTLFTEAYETRVNDSGLLNIHARLVGHGHDGRFGYNTTTAASVTNWGDNWTAFTARSGSVHSRTGNERVRIQQTVRANSASTERLYNFDYWYKDRVDNDAGSYSSNRTGLRVGVDGVAPTCSPNISSRGWDNSDVSVTITCSDSGSGFRRADYRTSSSSNPDSVTFSSGSTTNPRTITFSSSGTRYIHVRSEDWVGNRRIQTFGPYRVDKLNPTLANWNISGAYHAGSNNYWVRPSDTFSVQLDHQKSSAYGGMQGSGTQYIRLYDGTALNGAGDVRARYRDGWASNGHFLGTRLTMTNFTLNNHTSTRLRATYSWTPNVNSGTFHVQHHARDHVGNTVGYNGSSTSTTGSRIATVSVDNNAPTLNNISISGADHVDGNNHWLRPGSSADIRIRATDSESGIRNVNGRLIDNGEDARFSRASAWENWNNFTAGGIVSQSNSSSTIDFTRRVTANSTNSVLTHRLQYYLRDNVLNTQSYTNSGLSLNIDGVPPTISASPTNRAWDNSSVTVSMSFDDEGVGYRSNRFQWTQSTSQPSTGYSTWSQSRTSVSQSSDGVWYLHVEARDWVGNVTYQRFGPYRIDMTDPEEVSNNITGHRYQNGNDYWFQPNDNVDVILRGRDTGALLERVNIRVEGSGQDSRARHWFANGVSNLDEYRSSTHIDLNSATRTFQSADNETREVTFNLTPKTHGHNYDVFSWYSDNVGNTTNWLNTGKRIRVDGEPPVLNSISISGADHVSGNTHWLRPGSSATITLRGIDTDSGVREVNARLLDSGEDARWGGSTGTNTWQTWNNFSTGTVTNPTNTTSTREVVNTVTANSTNSVLTHRLQYFLRDNVMNSVAYSNSGLSLNIDGVPPTISASPTTTSWNNTDVTVNMSFSDTGSGYRSNRFQWTQSTSQPSTGYSTWSQSRTSTTQSNEGIWYLHIEARDWVGNVSYQRYGPYRIDKTPPTATFSPNSHYWTNDPIHVTINSGDDASGVNRIRYRISPEVGESYGSWTSWINSNSTNIEFNSAGQYRIQVQVEDVAGNLATFTSGLYQFNNPPVADFEFDKEYYYIGDYMNITSTSYDPDGHDMDYFYDVISPSGVYTEYFEKDISFRTDEVGIYTVVHTVVDEYGAYGMKTKQVEVRDLELEVHIEHMPSWEDFHDDLSTEDGEFFSGEAFIVNALVTDYPIASVTSRFVGLQVDNEVLVIDNDLDDYHPWYHTIVYDERMTDTRTRLQDGTIYFTVTAEWENGTVRVVTESVEIVGDIYSVFDFFKTN